MIGIISATRPSASFPSFPRRRWNGGFTLLELVLATMVATLVMGILSVALSFALRAWEREQTRKPLTAPAMLDLLKWQIMEFNPVQVKIDGQTREVFFGETGSLLMATTHSVKAISRGVPVVARYVFAPQQKRLYYAEIPFNPYDTRQVEEFMKLQPSDDPNARPRFYWSEVDSFTLAFLEGQDQDSRSENWEEGKSAPKAVVVHWVTPDGSDTYTSVVMLNSIFPIRKEDASRSGTALPTSTDSEPD